MSSGDSLNGRVAVVTGGAGGIGAEICHKLAEEGARVLVVDLPDGGRPDAVARQIADTGRVAVGYSCDISQSSAVKGMIDRAIEVWGRLDIVVNNAMWMGKGGPAAGLQGSAVELAEESWHYAFDVGLKSQFLATKFAVPHMVKNAGASKGTIVNISSVEGALMSRRNLAYATVKRAVMGLTNQTAVDFGPEGIRINAICPGFMVHDQNNEFLRGDAETAAYFNEQYPVGRFGNARDIAEAVWFLASDLSSFITGQAITVDGGLTLALQEDVANRFTGFWAGREGSAIRSVSNRIGAWTTQEARTKARL